MIRYNLLTEKLPDTVNVSGKEYSIRSDFRIGFKLEEIMRSDLSDEQKIINMLQVYYPVIPEDIPGAVNEALWFYRCGKKEDKQEEDKERYRSRNKKNVISYSFCQDAPYLYSAFLEQYGLDLCNMEMHWWKFYAMFESLSGDTQMGKIMYFRRVSTSGMPKDKRSFINEMKKIYKLEDPTACGDKVTLASRNARWRDYVRQRHGDVKEVM